MKKTPTEWLAEPEFANVTILNPDGWDRQNFAESFAVPITISEFRERLARSSSILT